MRQTKCKKWKSNSERVIKVTGKSHLLFGVGTGVVAALASPTFSVLHIPIFGIASLLPDLDSSSSMLGKRVKIIGKMFSHRGFLHTPLFLAIFLLIKNPAIKWAIIIGLASHLLLDLLNRGGIMLLYPFSRKKFKVLTLKCGTWAESGIVIALLILEIVCLKLCDASFPRDDIMEQLAPILCS